MFSRLLLFFRIFSCYCCLFVCLFIQIFRLAQKFDIWYRDKRVSLLLLPLACNLLSIFVCSQSVNDLTKKKYVTSSSINSLWTNVEKKTIIRSHCEINKSILLITQSQQKKKLITERFWTTFSISKQTKKTLWLLSRLFNVSLGL